MPGPERIIHIPRGQTARLVLEGKSQGEGSVFIDVKNNPSSTTPYSVEKKSLDPREEEREQLKAIFPHVLFPYAAADLNSLSYKAITGGEEIGSQMTFDEAQANMNKWIENARKAGFSDKDVGELSDSLLREFQFNPNLIKGIGTRVKNLVKEIWEIKKQKTK